MPEVVYNIFFLDTFKNGQHAIPLDYSNKMPGPKVVATHPNDINQYVVQYLSQGMSYAGKEEVVPNSVYNIYFLRQADRI